MSPTPGNALGHYTILEELGRGGQGIVYLADDTRLRRRVALKVLDVTPGTVADDRMVRFRREAKAASKLDHPNICAIHEAGEIDGHLFIAMRYVRGESLAQMLAHSSGESNESAVTTAGDHPSSAPSTRADIGRITLLIEKVARALHGAHEQGLIHRDIKPGNIMIGEDDEPVVLDFGLARDEFAVENTITHSGELLGTPAYMSPEQLRPQRTPLDRRTDIYSLGATLYECLTLRRPFQATTQVELYEKILRGDLTSAALVNHHVPRDLLVVLETAMERDRDRRYQTALDLAEDLRRSREFEPIRARPLSRALRMRRWMQRHPAASIALLALIATTLLASFAAVMLGNMASSEREARLATESLRAQGIQVAAKFAARTIATEIDLRWRILEAEAADPVMRSTLTVLDAADDPANHATRAGFQGWLERVHEKHSGTAKATSWLATDGHGRHLGRSPLDIEIVGKSFAFRDYFHGEGRDDPEETGGHEPSRDVHLSVVFRSQVTQKLIVAFSVPIWSIDDSPRVVGILAMTVELGHFGALQTDLGDAQLVVLVNAGADWIEGVERTGLVLHHPALSTNLTGDVAGNVAGNDGNGGDSGTALRIPTDRVAILRALRAKQLRPDGSGSWEDASLRRQPAPESFDSGYVDPAGGAYAGNWIAAFEPVLVNGRPDAQRNTGWFVIVQERPRAQRDD